jgi:hypothetical protein
MPNATRKLFAEPEVCGSNETQEYSWKAKKTVAGLTGIHGRTASGIYYCTHPALKANSPAQVVYPAKKA